MKTPEQILRQMITAWETDAEFEFLEACVLAQRHFGMMVDPEDEEALRANGLLKEDSE
jgi:hypothetical protein